MLTITGNRRSGKTTKAIMTAFATRSILVVPNHTQVKIIQRQARELGFPIEVVAATDYFTKHTGQKRRAVVDELDWVLHEIFRADIIAATISGAGLENEEDDNEKYYR